MTKVLFLTTRRRVSPLLLEEWVATLPVDGVEPYLVAMSLPIGLRRIGAQRFITLPATRRPRALPVDQPVRGGRKHPEVLGGKRLARSVQARYGAKIDERRLTRERYQKLETTRAERFQMWCSRTRQVSELFACMDLVVAIDNDAALAAWRLAQQYEKPAVVYTVAGAVRALRSEASFS